MGYLTILSSKIQSILSDLQRLALQHVHKANQNMETL